MSVNDHDKEVIALMRQEIAQMVARGIKEALNEFSGSGGWLTPSGVGGVGTSPRQPVAHEQAGLIIQEAESGTVGGAIDERVVAAAAAGEDRFILHNILHIAVKEYVDKEKPKEVCLTNAARSVTLCFPDNPNWIFDYFKRVQDSPSKARGLSVEIYREDKPDGDYLVASICTGTGYDYSKPAEFEAKVEAMRSKMGEVKAAVEEARDSAWTAALIAVTQTVASIAGTQMVASVIPTAKEEGHHEDDSNVVRDALRLFEQREHGAYVGSAESGSPDSDKTDINEVVLDVLGEAWKEHNEILRMYVDRLKTLNEAKRAIRELIAKIRKDVAANAGQENKSPPLDLSNGMGSPEAYRNAQVPVFDPHLDSGVRFVSTNLYEGRLDDVAQLGPVLDELEGRLEGLIESFDSNMQRLQLLMDKKDQMEKTFSNILKVFQNSQRDLVQNLK